MAMDVLGLLVQGGTVALLGGIFYRLGRVCQALEGLRDRVEALEEWRGGFSNIIRM